MKKEKQYTLRQQFDMILRGYKIFRDFPKPMLLSRTLSSVVRSAVPFINIYFSAQILNELSGARDGAKLTTLVLLTIGLNLGASLISNLITRWMYHVHSQPSWMQAYMLYTEKLLTMDFVDIENPEVRQDYTNIRQHQNGMGFGLLRLIFNYDGLIDGIIKIALSITLAFSLFTLKTPAGSALAWLDSPLAVLSVVVILCGSVVLAPYLTLVGGRVFANASHENNRGNRIFSFFFFTMINGATRAKDIRVYDQQRLINEGLKWFNFGNVFHKYAKYNGKFSALATAVSYLSNGLIYLFVALKALGGAFGVGSIVQYVGAITQFGAGFSQILSSVGGLMNNNPYLEKVLKFLDTPSKMYMGSLPVEKRDDNDYEIEFHDVSFKYPGSEQYALKNVSMKLRVGQRLAVVGMNGSGKTTMIKLLCRLYDPTEGEITLNGIDIKKYDYAEYMGIFSVVFQDFKLLPFTLGENVAASVDYDADRVTETLAMSGFGTRLEKMSKGIGTYLYKNFEEDGVEISGGEAQKIALARALYKGAPFIVLDEPTAALDPIAEYEIYSKFNEIVEDRTAVYISHRLSSCRFCDDIAVFHEGVMVQRGSHEDLLADEGGKYAELWNAQAQYYAAEEVEGAIAV